MKDIDFDELDKAVNSLMSASAEKTTEPAAAPEAKEAVADTPQPATAETPVDQSKESIPEPAAETVAEPVAVSVASTTPKPKTAAPAKRRGGKFMDVMPSSAGARPAGPVSRVGASIAPPTDAAETSDSPAKEPEEVEPTPKPADAHTMPDPIDMAKQPESEAMVEAVAEPTPEETSIPKASADSTPESTDNLGSESPFLSDAKVEKRPLGGEVLEEDAPSDEKDDGVEASAEDETIEEPSQLPAEPTQAELKADVVAVEAGEHDNLENDTQSNAGMEAGAINQQYKEEQSTGDESHAAIYDTQPYPTNKKVKKKSGWLWVLWIFILLSLGAGGAVALYLMNII